MKNKFSYTFILLFIIVLVFDSFMDDNPYFKITAKDVELTVPKGFPKPVYNFTNNKITPEIFVLGRKLFYDPILSKDNSISCSSCHQRIAAFAHLDHSLSHGIYGKIGKRNIPSLQNLIWKNDFMWDGGVNHLEIQPISPITNSVEMDETLKNVVSKLQKDTNYVAQFKLAFGDTIMTSQKMLKAISQFVGLMISSNSRYDKYIAGKDTFSVAEKNGLKLFRTKCANCHREPLFTDNSFRNNGIKMDTALKDTGRALITKLMVDKLKFKVPTLRNIEMTYPYMHDGRFRNLKQVINHYSTSRNYDIAVDSSLFKIGILSEIEKIDLIAFLKTLTDKTFLYDRRFADPNTK